MLLKLLLKNLITKMKALRKKLMSMKKMMNQTMSWRKIQKEMKMVVHQAIKLMKTNL